jgi:hypothetical protein
MAQQRGLHERELLDALERMPSEAFSGPAWRATWSTRDPLRGSAAGGRWSPTDAFDVLNTSLEADGAIAETYFHLSRAPVFSSAHSKLHRLHVETRRTLRFEDVKALAPFGVDAAAFKQMRYDRTQALGAAAHFLEFDALIVPSARWPCLNLILFLDRLDGGAALRVEETCDINWPAWREKHATASASGPERH